MPLLNSDLESRIGLSSTPLQWVETYPIEFRSIDVDKGAFPRRGLVCSTLIHLVVVAFIIYPSLAGPPNFRGQPHKQWDLTMIPKDKLYLPPLGGGSEGRGPKGRAELKRGAKKAVARKARAGFSYPGVQPIVSNPPHPTNHLQTILQPGPKKLPEMTAFVPLPNIVQTAAPPPPLLKAPHSTAVPAAPDAVATPRPPLEPHVPNSIPLVAAQPVAAPRLALPPTVPTAIADAALPPAPAPPEPKVVVPKSVALPQATGTNARDLLVVSAMPAPPSQEIKVPAYEARGQFVVTPGKNPNPPEMPPGAPGQPDAQSASAPLGASTSGSASGTEATGESAGTGTGSATGTGKGGEGGTEGHGASTGEGVGSGVGPGTGHGPGTNPGSGSGPGAGGGAGPNPFPGISIQGGEGPAGVVNLPAHTGNGKAGEEGSYGLTVVSTGNNGGGLGDFGVFIDEAVFTDYLNVSDSATDPEPNWILQYAVINGGNSGLDNLVPPFPVAKVKPEWPADLVPKFRGQMLVAYGVIDVEGKVRGLRIIQSPGVRFSVAISKALDGWAFRPARVNDRPVAVKALLGIPIGSR